MLHYQSFSHTFLLYWIYYHVIIELDNKTLDRERFYTEYKINIIHKNKGAIYHERSIR